MTQLREWSVAFLLDRVVLLFFGALILVATFVNYCTSIIKQPPAPSAAEDVTRAADTSVSVHDDGQIKTSHVEGEVISHPRTNEDVIVHSSLELVTIERLDATPPRAESEYSRYSIIFEDLETNCLIAMYGLLY